MQPFNLQTLFWSQPAWHHTSYCHEILSTIPTCNWTADLHKLDEWQTLVEPDNMEWFETDSEEDDDEEDDEDEEEEDEMDTEWIWAYILFGRFVVTFVTSEAGTTGYRARK